MRGVSVNARKTRAQLFSKLGASAPTFSVATDPRTAVNQRSVSSHPACSYRPLRPRSNSLTLQLLGHAGRKHDRSTRRDGRERSGEIERGGARENAQPRQKIKDSEKETVAQDSPPAGFYLNHGPGDVQTLAARSGMLGRAETRSAS